MEDDKKESEELIDRSAGLRQRVSELESLLIKHRRVEDLLQKSEKEFRDMLEDIDEGYFEVDLDSKLTFFNDSVCKILGYSRNQLLGMPFQDYTTPDTAKVMDRVFSEIQRTGNPSRIKDCEIIKKDGGISSLEISTSLMRNSSGQPIGFRGFMRNVRGPDRNDHELQAINLQLEATNRELEKAIERSNQMALEAEITNIELNQIFNTSADGMWVIDHEFNVRRINETLLTLFGKSQEEAVGQKCYDLFSGSLCGGPDCAMNRIMGGEGRIDCDIEKVFEDGMTIPFILTASPFRGIDGELIGIVESLKDITDRKRAEEALEKANEELHRLATIDGLTQVANRRQFDENLNREWNRLRRDQSPLSIIMCDVDFFKLYNDIYGHQLGDDCLRAVAQAISANVKRSADLVARYGGEEFALILPNTDVESALHVAESIRIEVQRLKRPHAKSSVSPYVTLSLGVSTAVPSGDFLPETIVEVADKALYEAKENGRNRVIFKSLA